MTNSELLISLIDSFYKDTSLPFGDERYELLCDNHAKVISIFEDCGLWNDIGASKPREREKVVCIQDLSPIGKGVFVGDYFYEDGNFVANLGDCDPYGCITHWISVEYFDSLVLPMVSEFLKGEKHGW